MAMKIKDGLFISDAETSQSEDFINDNKISNLINVAGRELPNLWAAHGLVYMTFHWEDRPDFKLGLNSYRRPNGGHGDFVADMVEFIDISIMHGISVLIFSKNGTGRCAVAVCVYLMVKYRWSFEKAYEFVYSKKMDIHLNPGFVQQLFAFDKHLLLLAGGPEHYHFASARHDAQDPSSFLNLMASTILSKNDYMRWKDWNPAYLVNKGDGDGNSISNSGNGSGSRSGGGGNSNSSNTEPSYDNDELLLLYSYINSKVSVTSLPGPYRAMLDAPPKQTKLRFGDSKVDTYPYQRSFPLSGILKINGKTNRRLDEAGYSSSNAHGHNSANNSNNHANNHHNSGGASTISSNSHSKNGFGSDSGVSSVNGSGNSSSSFRAEEKGSSRSRGGSDSSSQQWATAPSNGSTVDFGDLYGYVGVDAGQAKDEISYEAPSRLASAEERLKHLVAGLTQSQSRGTSFTNGMSSTLSSSVGYGEPPPGADRYSSQRKPVEYTDSRRPPGRSDSRSTFDPLQAFDAIQRGGVVKARHNPDTARPPAAAKSAWAETVPASRRNDDNASIDSGMYSTNSYTTEISRQRQADSTARQSYRHGSPAPRSQQRSSSATSSSRSAPVARQPSPAKNTTSSASSGSRPPSPFRSSSDSQTASRAPSPSPSSSALLNQTIRRRGSDNSLMSSAESIDSTDVGSLSRSARLSNGDRGISPRPTARSVDAGDPTAPINTRRYASPQTKSTRSTAGAFESSGGGGTGVPGRSSTPSRATWKY